MTILGILLYLIGIFLHGRGQYILLFRCRTNHDIIVGFLMSAGGLVVFSVGACMACYGYFGEF